MINDLFDQLQIDELSKMLANYSPRPDVLKRLRSTPFGVIMGPAGSGKDTLRQALLSMFPDDFSLLLSDTSREKRQHEQEGVEYNFKSLDLMITGFKNGDYLQGALVHGQQLSGLNSTNMRISNNQTPISILIIQTVEELINKGLNLRGIFLVPPSLEEMRERLSIRQGVSKQEQDRRINTAKIELELALKHDEYQFIVTETVERSVRISYDFLKSGIVDDIEQQKSRSVAQELVSSLYDVK